MNLRSRSPLFEIALVLVRLDHVASGIVKADDRITAKMNFLLYGSRRETGLWISFGAVARVISGVYGCATRAGRARRPQMRASCTSYTRNPDCVSGTAKGDTRVRGEFDLGW